MTDSPVQQIKERLDIVEVIRDYLKLQKTGANFRAVCPFHSEKKPSFFISPARQIWHCFGCNSGGDIFRFIMQIEGVEFGDALRILAQRAGIELKRQDPKLRTERQRLFEITELATKFFERQLEASKTGQEAKNYLLRRGLNEESIKKWRLGYAPDIWQGLSDFLVGKGYKRDEVAKAGLAVSGREDSFYDRFRGRIIFPIFDLNSQVIGFGARIFGTDQKTTTPSQKTAEGEVIAKYVNTPATVLYDKSRVLYGLDKGKVPVRKKDACILVEGYIDVILSHQAGQENTVATSGTALTLQQLRILRRYSENLLTAFDMDVAGDNATKRGIDLAQSQGFNVKVITIPGEKDPADIISKDPENWENIIKEAKSIVEFYFQTVFSRYPTKERPLSPEEKREISKILLPVLKKIQNKIEQSHWVQQIAKNLQVKEEDIIEELNKLSSAKANEPFEGKDFSAEIEIKPKSRKEMIEERIIALLLRFPDRLCLLEPRIIHCFSPGIQQIATVFKETPGADLAKSITPDLADLYNYLSLKSEVEEFEDPEGEIKTCLREIICLDKKDKLFALSRDIKKAEESKDSAQIQCLAEEFNKVSRELFES